MTDFSERNVVIKETTVIKKTTDREVYNTSIIQDKGLNCPKLIRTFEEDGELYMELEKIEGVALAKAKLNDSELDIVFDNIITEVNKLRELNIELPYKTLDDPLFGELNIENERAFNECLVTGQDIFREAYLTLLPTDSKFVLTHGGLDNSTIIVKENLDVYFIDWEALCYMPDYWDYQFLMFWNPWYSKVIFDKVKLNKVTSLLCCELFSNRLV